MMDMLLKQFMPKDFDMETATKAVADKANEITRILAIVDFQADQIAYMNKQLQAVIYRIEPDARPVAAWLVINGKTGEQHSSVSDPKEMITPEDIANNQLNIVPLFTL